jgi:hypothetical protein
MITMAESTYEASKKRPVYSRRRAIGLLAAAVLTTILAGCGSGDDWSRPHPEPTARGVLKAGFSNPTATPAPESTITPSPGSWDDVHPPKDYRVVLLTAGSETPTKTLTTAVTAWADDEDVDLRTIAAGAGDDLVPSITKAIGMHPDLIISAGNDLIDPLTVVSASQLGQQFLTIGAEVAEPTGNVTAVDWTGGSFRGEGLEASSPYDPATFTPERSAAAIRAGAAAVLNEFTGIVIWLD